jgi:hypothetical protein
MKEVGDILVNQIWAFEIGDLPAVLQHDKLRIGDCLGDVSDAFGRDKVMCSP